MLPRRSPLAAASHDPKLNPALTRTADRRWLQGDGPPIRSIASSELHAYDVGRIDPSQRYAKTWTRQVAVDGERMPTLAQLSALARDALSPGGHPIRFNIETKLTPSDTVPTASAEEFARAIVREVTAAGLTEHVTVQSFDWRSLRALKRIAPSIRTVCLTIEAQGMNAVRADRFRTSGASTFARARCRRLCAAASVYCRFTGNASPQANGAVRKR